MPVFVRSFSLQPLVLAFKLCTLDRRGKLIHHNKTPEVDIERVCAHIDSLPANGVTLCQKKIPTEHFWTAVFPHVQFLLHEFISDKVPRLQYSEQWLTAALTNFACPHRWLCYRRECFRTLQKVETTSWNVSQGNRCCKERQRSSNYFQLCRSPDHWHLPPIFMAWRRGEKKPEKLFEKLECKTTAVQERTKC